MNLQSMQLLRSLESFFYQIEIVLRRSNARFGFLLKSMKYINRLGKLDCVNRSISIPVEIFDDLDHAGAAEAPHRFCVWMFSAALRNFESESQM